MDHIRQSSRLKIATFLILLASSNVCFAGVSIVPYLEPYVGLGTMQVAVKSTVYGDYDDKEFATGFMLGIKGGVKVIDPVFIGLDYYTSGPYEFGRLLTKAKWSTKLLGAGIGADYKVIRFWGGYYFMQDINDSQNSITYSGNAFKVGFGLPVYQTLHANVDFIQHNFKKRTDLTGVATDISDQYKVQTLNVSISIPIDIK